MGDLWVTYGRPMGDLWATYGKDGEMTGRKMRGVGGLRAWCWWFVSVG